MYKKIAAVAISIVAFATSAVAQTTVTTTTGGTPGKVPVFNTNSHNIENSSITVSGGKVGIGTTTPNENLEVNGSPIVVDNAQSGDAFYSNIFWNNQAWQYTASNVPAFAIRSMGLGSDTFEIMTVPHGTVGSTTTASFHAIAINGATGAVGIGTTSPGASYKLDVNGTIHASGGVVFPDGVTQMYAFNPANCGADYAESVDVSGDRTKYEAGDILVIDPDAPGKFLRSNQAYSTLVAGIYSTKPGFVGRLQPEDAQTDKTEVPMAMVGRVPTKVSAENGPIRVGDLLVASSTLGYAMKGTDRSLLTGAVIGKALGSLDSGTGVVMVLVTLQ